VVEVIVDRGFAATGDEDELLDARRPCLLEGVLDDGFVHHGQHFLGHGLGGRQHSGAKASDGKHGFANHEESPNFLDAIFSKGGAYHLEHTLRQRFCTSSND